MDNRLPVLQNIEVAAPCSADWNEMTGNDRVRFCGDCKLNVYNLSAMTATEVQGLIRETEGRLCGRFYRRPDGTILTQDCPKGLRAIVRRRLVGIAGRIGAAVVFLAGLVGAARLASEGGNSSGATNALITKIRLWFNPAPPVIMGEIMCPPPPMPKGTQGPFSAQ